VAENAVTRLPLGEKPMVVSPLGAVPKRGTNKSRLTLNMRFVNRHLEKKVFKFEGLKDLADCAKKGDLAVSSDPMSGYYRVGLHPRSGIFVGFGWKGTYYVYNYPPPLGISTTPWVFSKAIRELAMYWRRECISVLPYLDGFMSIKQGFQACVRLARRLERDFVRKGLRINVLKCHTILALQRRQLGFDVDFAVGKFQVPLVRWEALKCRWTRSWS